MNFNKIIETENTFYGINDSVKGKVVAQRIAAKNQFGVCLRNEPLYIGILWKKESNGRMSVIDENGLSVLRTTKIVNTFIVEGKV